MLAETEREAMAPRTENKAVESETEKEAMATEAKRAPVTAARRVRNDLEDSIPKPCEYFLVSLLCFWERAKPHNLKKNKQIKITKTFLSIK